MPFYKNIKADTPEGKRTIERLLQLRKQLGASVPEKSAEKRLLLASWNIREFDSPAFGQRLDESIYYIAEIISHFDLVAIQEVRQDLRGLDRLMDILGHQWDCLFSDITVGMQGNDERMAFVFDRRKVLPGGLVGQLVLPPLEIRDENRKLKYVPVDQVVRTPLIVGFKSGWTDFILTTVHIIYGEAIANSPKRVEEIRQVAQFLKKRSESPFEWSRNFILLGDFNIFKPEDNTLKMITDAGFVIPPELQRLPSNIEQNKYYDQIAFRVRPGKFGATGRAGVFNYYHSVFRPEDEAIYADAIGPAYLQTSDGKERKNKTLYYKTHWRTHQMSDHLPMWVELRIDFSDEYLVNKLLPVVG
jgi:endonuclease/exonuclease/phosphatase family metal-dependent hydrolase